MQHVSGKESVYTHYLLLSMLFAPVKGQKPFLFLPLLCTVERAGGSWGSREAKEENQVPMLGALIYVPM